MLGRRACGSSFSEKFPFKHGMNPVWVFLLTKSYIFIGNLFKGTGNVSNRKGDRYLGLM